MIAWLSTVSREPVDSHAAAKRSEFARATHCDRTTAGRVEPLCPLSPKPIASACNPIFARCCAVPGITLDPPETQGGTAQVRIGENVLGTVDQVDDEGERSWAVTLVVLEEDLE